MKISSRKQESNGKQRSYLPRDENGRIKAGPSRKKGVPNKITSEAKHAIALAFEGIGGVPALIKWAQTNTRTRSIFYSQLYAKLIPLNVQADVDATIEQHNETPAQQALELILTRLLAERQDKEVSGGPNDEPRMPLPQLVVVRTPESDAI
jgi:hypothetical protein